MKLWDGIASYATAAGVPGARQTDHKLAGAKTLKPRAGCLKGRKSAVRGDLHSVYDFFRRTSSDEAFSSRSNLAAVSNSNAGEGKVA